MVNDYHRGNSAKESTSESNKIEESKSELKISSNKYKFTPIK